MNILETTLAIALSGSGGALIVYLNFQKSRTTEERIGEQLMNAVNKARQDVLGAYSMLDELERVNMVLRQENHQLKVENMDLKQASEELREQLHDALDNIFFLQEQIEKYYPKSAQRNGNKKKPPEQ